MPKVNVNRRTERGRKCHTRLLGQTNYRRELVDRVPVSLQEILKHPAPSWRKSCERFALWTQRPAKYLGRLLDATRERMLVKKSEYRFDAVEQFPSFPPALFLNT
jgi:hypothetical protein